MILVRREIEGKIFLQDVEGEHLLVTHAPVKACETYSCVIHNPSVNVMSDFPLNWCGDRGIMERICPHGVGHPDIDSAARFDRMGLSEVNTHGCDGCCVDKEED